MAIVHEVQIDAGALAGMVPVAVRDSIIRTARTAFARAVWDWYADNEDMVLRRVLVFTVRVRDVRRLFEIIAGPQP